MHRVIKPQICYAVNSDFAMAGTGGTVYHEAVGLHKAGMLYRILCRHHAPSSIPESLIRDIYPGGRRLSQGLAGMSFYSKNAIPGQHWSNLLFGKAAAKNLGEPDIFVGWNFPVAAQREAKRRGIIVVKETASSHPHEMKKISDREKKRRGIALPVAAANLRLELEEIALVDHIVVPSAFVRDGYIRQGVPKSKISVNGLGCDVKRFTPSPVPQGKFVALFIGQIQHRKGILDLIDAWEKAALPDAELWLAGIVHRDVAAAVQRFAKRPDVKLLGFVDPAKTLRDAHVMVFPSLEDGWALVVTEAMACGRPVIVSDHCGVVDIVRDGKDGFVVKAGDVDAIVRALRKAHGDRPLLARMGKAARQQVERHTWEHTGKRLVTLYTALYKRLRKA
jgi:glycosyltransferase involved in cell wall biosynthesis